MDQIDLGKVVGKNIKLIRVQRGLTQVELSEKSKIMLRSLSKMENEGSNFRLSTLQALASALEVSIFELLEGIEASNPERNEKIEFCIDLLKKQKR